MYNPSNNQQNNNANIREITIDGVRYQETILIENPPILRLSATNRSGELYTRSILDILPEGTEELTLEEALRNEQVAHQMVIDSLGRNPVTIILQNSSAELTTLVENRQIISTQITETHNRTVEATQSVINQNGLWDYFLRFLIAVQEIPMYQKIILTGGSIAFIIGGTYIGIKVIRRNSVITSVTPFGIGIQPENNLTFIGVCIKRASNFIHKLSIQK